MLFRPQREFFVSMPQVATGKNLMQGWVAAPYPGLIIHPCSQDGEAKCLMGNDLPIDRAKHSLLVFTPRYWWNCLTKSFTSLLTIKLQHIIIISHYYSPVFISIYWNKCTVTNVCQYISDINNSTICEFFINTNYQYPIYYDPLKLDTIPDEYIFAAILIVRKPDGTIDWDSERMGEGGRKQWYFVWGVWGAVR